MRRLCPVHKSPRLWEVYRDNFIPGQFKFELSEPRSNKQVYSPTIEKLLQYLPHHQNKVHSYRRMLEKILFILATGNNHQYQCPGRLYYQDSRQPVEEGRLATDMVGVSKDFMCRKGQIWPFEGVSVRDADKYGLQAVIELM